MPAWDFSDFAYRTDPLPFVSGDMRGYLARACESLRGAIGNAGLVSIYVDPVNGLDTNVGTQAAPLQTLPAALDMVPYLWRRKVTINLAAGTYTLPDIFAWYAGHPIGVNNPADYDGNVSFLGGSTSGAGRNLRIQGTYTTIDSGTVTGVTNTGGGQTYQVTDGTKAWAAGVHDGRIMRFLDGPAANIAFRIRATAATTVDALMSVTPAVTVGNHYVIEEPASIVVVKYAGFYGVQGSNYQGLDTDGILWKPAINGAELEFLGISGHHTDTFGDGSGNKLFADFQQCVASLQGNRYAALSFYGNLRYWTGSFLNNAAIVWNGSLGNLEASGRLYAVLRNGSQLGVTYHSRMVIAALDADGGQALRVTDMSEVELSWASTPAGFTAIKIYNSTTHGGIWVDISSTLKMWYGAMDLTGNAPAGVVLDHGSFAQLIASVTGAANNAYGISVQHGSKLDVGAGVVVAGTTNEALIGATAATWAGIQAAAVADAASQSAAFKE